MAGLDALHGSTRRGARARQKPPRRRGLSAAVTVGFEPTVGVAYTTFRVSHLRPLGHVTNPEAYTSARLRRKPDHRTTRVSGDR